jgi:hypothetical protein
VLSNLGGFPARSAGLLGSVSQDVETFSMTAKNLKSLASTSAATYGLDQYGNPNNRGGLVGGSDSGTYRP